MMRAARVATVCLAVILGARAASAQTPAAPSALDYAFYAEVNGGATLGHTSDKSVGVEAGRRITDRLDGFLEGGHIGNAATTDFAQRGQKIATALGASVSAVEKVNYFDVGVRYHIEARPTLHPYVAFGVGVAHVRTETNLSINGTPVSPDSVLLGDDLAGTFNRPFVMIGFGANLEFARRYFAELSYRFGHISEGTTTTPSGSNEVLLAAVPTQRVQIGVGIRF
jgi:opacity protein-like surface antigen